MPRSPMPFTYTHAWTLAATPDRVFRALTEPAELRRWFAEDVQVEHGVYRFWGRHTPGTPAREDARGTIARVEPNRLFSFNWPLFEVDTTVTIELLPHASGMTMSLTHDVSADLPVPRQRALIEDFWRAAIGNLESHLAGTTPVLPDYFANPTGRDSSGSS